MSRSGRHVALALLLAVPVAAASSPVPVPQGGRPAPEAYRVAIGMQQRGLHEEAVRHFADFLKRHGKHRLVAEANYRLAVSQIELGQKEPAVAALRRALQVGGESFALRPEGRYRLGNLLQEANAHAEAAVQFDALGKELEPGHYLVAPAAFAGGECHRELGSDAAALLAFERAARAAQGDQAAFLFPALYQLGFARLRLEELAAAAEAFALAAEAAPDAAARGECRFLRGDALLRLERWGEAEQALQRALEVPSEFRDDAAFGLGWVALGKGDPTAAQLAFARLIRDHAKSPHVPKARLELGRSLYQTRKYAEAEKVLASLSGSELDSEVQRQARELRGLCALASGAGEAAVKTLTRSLAEAAPADQARLAFALGEALSNITRWQEAVDAYALVKPDIGAELFGDACYGACFALHQLARHEDSIAQAQKVLALEPRHRLYEDAAFAVAENLYLLERYEQADAAYARLGERSRMSPKALWKRAWCQYLTGKRGAAAARFAAIAKTEGEYVEEALSMEALSRLEADDRDGALAAADRYRARFARGAFLDRTERVAARVLKARGDLAGARKRLHRAAEAAAARDEDVRGDRLEQAELAYQEGDFRAAAELFSGLCDDAETYGARALAGCAWCAFELGEDEACASWLAKGLAHPQVGDGAVGLLELQSALCHRREDWQGAIAAAGRFLQRFAKHEKAPAIRYALGVAQARTGDHAAARKTLGALEQEGTFLERDRLAYELAWACRRDGDEPAALAAFGRCVEATKDVELAGEGRLHLGLAALESAGPEAARPLLLAVKGSQRGRALYRLGFAEFEAAGEDQAKLGQARGRFDAIAAIEGEELRSEALYLGAECSQRIGDARGAVQRAGLLLESAPEHRRSDRARLVFGECAVQVGDGDRAVPELERYLRTAKRTEAEAARGWLALGRARLLRGEHERAGKAFVRVTELSDGPLAAEAQFRIGQSRQQAGDLPGAIDAFVKLPILYAHAKWVRRGLLQAGLAYEQQKQPEKARRIFQELIDKHPKSEEATAAKERLRDG